MAEPSTTIELFTTNHLVQTGALTTNVEYKNTSPPNESITMDHRVPLSLTQEDYQATSRLIKRICHKFGIDEHTIHDVLQESLIVVVRKFNGRELDSDTYNGESFSSRQVASAAMYACRCAYRIAPNFRRSRTRRDIHWLRLAESLDPESIGVCPPMHPEDIHEMDLAACVRQHLSPKENQLREMLENGLKVSEISQHLGISKWACHKRVRRLMKKVEVILYGETGPTEPESG